jgi:hypothetical protein
MSDQPGKNGKIGGKVLARKNAQTAGNWSALARHEWFLDANQTRANQGDAVIPHAKTPLSGVEVSSC